MKHFFKLISFILNPVFIMVILYIMGLIFFKFTFFEKLSISIFQLVIPIAVFSYHLYKGKIDFDLTERTTRIPLLVVALACFGAGAIITYIGGHTAELKLELGILFTFLIFTLITTHWKISFHSFVLTVFFVLNIRYVSELFIYPAFVIIPMIMYARLYLKKHTPMQTIAGTLLGLSIILFL